MCSLCALLRSVALNLRSICAHFALLTSALLYPFAGIIVQGILKLLPVGDLGFYVGWWMSVGSSGVEEG